jgi:PKD repeat protein
MRTTTYLFTIAAAALTLISGCTVKDVDAPAFSGPSTFANNIILRSSTDTLIQDGVSQAVITITATDANGNAKNIPLRADITVDGVVQDFGRLNTKTPTANGTPLVYTAPPSSTLANSQVAQTVTILVTPMDAGDFRSEVPRQIDIRLVPQGVILPINPNLVAEFTVSPNPPKVLDVVLFDASVSTNSGAACGASCTYAWDFGDGTGASGQSTTHQYRTVGVYQAKLTVTDNRGAQAIKVVPLNVGVGALPTVDFLFTPSNPGINQTIFFNASSLTKPAAGRTIVSYEWDFGKGTTGSGATVTKSYDTVGTYQVTLKVTDDAGAVGFKTIPVTIGTTANPTAKLTASPTTNINTSTDVFFDASTSTPSAAPIVQYRFTWGDGTADLVTQSSTATHRFSRAATYVVTVTVTDSEGRQHTASVNVTVG